MTYGGSFVHETTLPILLLVEDDLLILLVGNVSFIFIHFYELYINIMQPKTWLHGYRKIYNLEGVSYYVLMHQSIKRSLLLPAASPIPSPKTRILPSQTIASHLGSSAKTNEPILFMGTLASLSWRPFHWENRSCQRAFYFPQKLIIWAHLRAHYVKPAFLLLWIHCPDPS